MPWIRSPGLTGKIYLPEKDDRTPQKHPCENCFSCQWCDENRCHVCRNDNGAQNTNCPNLNIK